MTVLRIYIVVIIGMFSCFNCSGQFKNSKVIKNDISKFITNVKDNGNEYSNRYMQFMFRVYLKELTEEDRLCYKGSYIMNSFELKNIKASHFLVLENDTILFSISDGIDNRLLKGLNFKPLNEKISIDIKKKLFPEKNGGFTYRPDVFLNCYPK